MRMCTASHVIHVVGACLGLATAACAESGDPPWVITNATDANSESTGSTGNDAGAEVGIPSSPDSGMDAPVVEASPDAEADGEAVAEADVQAETSVDAPVGPEQTVIFEDEFEQVDPTPDTAKWSLCPNIAPVAWGQYLSGSYDQAYVENGRLIVKGEKVGGMYKTGGIQTRGKFEFTFGKVEVSARFTRVQGGWPAIWMMPSGGGAWPDGGEIDIMEMVNYETVVHQTVHSHYCNDLGQYDNPPRSAEAPYNLGAFNTYAVEWTAEEIIFSVNGTVSLTYPNLHLADEATQMQWPFKTPFYVILNFALGGDWPGPITDSELPGMMEVDWVRVTRTQQTNTD